ncbi:MAG: SPOR domain-containing protein [Desulfatiglandales bacterium]
MARKRSQEKKEGPKVRLEISRAAMFLWVFVFLFLLIWVFALGVLAGRGSVTGDLAVEELKEQMAKIQEIVRREGPRRAEQADEPPPDSPRLSFYDNLATKKDETRQAEASHSSAPGSKTVSPAETLVERAPSPGMEARTPEKQTATVRMEVQPPEKQRDSRLEPTEPAQTAGAGAPSRVVGREGHLIEARFTVQVAAVESKSAAEEMIEGLKRKGHPAYYYDAEVDGKTFYRVRCGRFLSRAEAEEYAAVLAKKEGLNGFVSRFE